MGQDQFETAISNLSTQDVALVVEQICGSGYLAIQPHEVRATGNKSAGGGTLGIYRVTGTATNGDRHTPWSAVVKVLGEAKGFHDSDTVELEREIEVYRSKAFEELSGAFRAARCYLIQNIDDNSTGIWMEDLTDSLHAPWPLEQYPVSAQHLGEFNAAWTGRSLPDWDWLSNSPIEDLWTNPAAANVFNNLSDPAMQSSIQSVLPSGGVERLTQFQNRSNSLLTAVASVETGIGHIDAHPKNFFVLNHDTDSPTTVAVDWPYVGRSPLGIDVGLFIISPLLWLEITVNEAKDLIEPIFEAYLRGIRNVGWEGDDPQIRMSYLAGIGVYGVNRKISMAHRVLTDDSARNFVVETIGHPADELIDSWRDALEFLLQMTDEAFEVSEKLDH
jgi:hypothetical protein